MLPRCATLSGVWNPVACHSCLMRAQSRRRLLQVAIGSLGALVITPTVAACGGSTEAAGAAGTTPAPSGVSTLAEQARNERMLIARYDLAIQAVGQDDTQRAGLTLLRDQHQEHLAALISAEPSLVSSDADQDRAAVDASDVITLIQAERDACAQRSTAAAAADRPEIARLLTLIAAAEGSHVAYLAQQSSGASR